MPDSNKTMTVNGITLVQTVPKCGCLGCYFDEDENEHLCPANPDIDAGKKVDDWCCCIDNCIWITEEEANGSNI